MNNHVVTPSRLELLTPRWKRGDLDQFVEGAILVCRTGFEPVNRNGAVLQTVCFNHLHTDTCGASGWNWTNCTRFFRPLLYQLSYRSIWWPAWESNPQPSVWETDDLPYSSSRPYDAASCGGDYAMTKMSSILVSSIAANITRLSMVGSAVPACHLATACVDTPSVSATSFTLIPAAFRSVLMLAPVFWISIVGTFIFLLPFCIAGNKKAACRNLDKQLWHAVIA